MLCVRYARRVPLARCPAPSRRLPARPFTHAHAFSDPGTPPRDPPPPHTEGPEDISDQEWELRTGRGIYVLQETLPDFFKSGLVTSIDKETGEPRRSSPLHIPIAHASPLDFLRHDEDIESIYSPNVRLSYTPKAEHVSALLPKNLTIEGYSFYLASSVLLRRGLSTMYHDLHVELTKMRVTTGGSKPHPDIPTPPPLAADSASKRKSREKSLYMLMKVQGIARVSGNLADWEVATTYTFSPATGLILQHTIHSIHPEPSRTVYDSVATSLTNLFGLGGPARPGAGTACSGGPDASAACSPVKESDSRKEQRETKPEPAHVEGRHEPQA
ncbi:uncharacterized protein SCHCODRAFT_02641973 [Schizophyllum commune H4-8]|uniref:Uncharacterized protein n=1 Tax=Schizophyllum commune (strain H4-8 / FGSC 9210) TaxID=578458 RepID=D8QM33_SCHCM|nr:uncharacterized protein SCHCODRAFT_02641973 [Schizophyllum commune H4-8]KAI5886547.1 hypothetical protein SCHCODRAFT_02641973 [Schizophyllum commune H4-8]